MCGGHGRSVFAAACLVMSRFLANAGRCSVALHTCVKGSAQAVKPDVCRCAAVKKKHISSSTISTIIIWYTYFIPMPQAMKIPAAKAADKEWENWKRFRRGT